jgi:hypothetical protein
VREKTLATARLLLLRETDCSTGPPRFFSFVRNSICDPHDREKERNRPPLKSPHEAPQMRQHADKSTALERHTLTSRLTRAIDIARVQAGDLAELYERQILAAAPSFLEHRQVLRARD